MTLRITCPGCKTALKFSDDKRGRKVRCTNCDKALSIPSANGKAGKAEEDEDEEQAQEERPVKKKKKKKKKAGAPVALYAGIGVGVLLLLLIVGGATAYFLRDSAKPAPAPAPPGPVAQNKDGPAKDGQADPVRSPQRIVVPDIREGNPANQKAGGKSITGNIRGAAYVTERKSELSQIGKMFMLFYNDVPKSGRTKEAFIDYMKRDAKPIADSIKDGYYEVNMRAELTGTSIIAYEAREYAQGYLCVDGNGVTDFKSVADWKAALGK